MGRPETRRWVSPVGTTFCLLLLMLQGHVLLASTIFPVKSNSPFRALGQSSSSWDIDDVDTATYNDDDQDIDQDEYANFFSEENLTAAEDKYYDNIRKANDNNIEENRSDFLNSLESYSNSIVSLPGRFVDDENMDETPKDGNSLGKIRPVPLISLEMHTIISPTKRLAGGEKLTITPPNTKSLDNHDNSNNKNNDVNGNGAKESYQDKRRMRFMPSKYIRGMSDSGKNNKATMGSSLVNNPVVLISKAAKNLSKHGRHVPGGEKESSSSLLSKFPYRIIPFPYVGRRILETEHKNTRIQPQKNTNEDGWTTDPRHKFVNGHDVLLQRRNRSRRDTEQQQQIRDMGELEQELLKPENTRVNADGETQLNSEQNQQHKSTEKSSTGSGEEGYNSADEVAKTNVRDNATSRPPSNPVEVLQRLTRLLDRMLRELSMFGQKFTLRLIRMTERQDIDQMQEIMKDFEISGEKPIFFIAGGLRKLNGSVAARVVTSPIAAIPTTNLAKNVSRSVLNETVQNEVHVEQLPVAVVNSTSSEEELPPTLPDKVDEMTVVPILRPSAISSLPVEYDTDDDGETTTVIPEEGESEPVALLVHEQNRSSNSSSHDETLVETATSPRPLLLLTRRKRSVYEEFNFLPIPGRSARTENPYDDEEGYDNFSFYDYEPTANGGSAEERLHGKENFQHLPSVVPTSSATSSNKIITSVNSAPSEVINQSHVQQNDDEISLNTRNTTIGHVGKAKQNTFSTTTTRIETEATSGESSPVVIVNDLNEADASTVTPSNNSATIRVNPVASDERSNDHQTQPTVVTLKNNISHEETYLVKPLRAVSIVDDVDVDQPLSVSAAQITLKIIHNPENKSTPAVESIDEKLRADGSLNLVDRETSSAEQSREVNWALGNGLLVMNKSALQTVEVKVPLPLSSNAPTELLTDKKSKVVAADLPAETLLVEERALGSGSGQNVVVQKNTLDDNILIKEVEFGSQDPQSPKLNPTTFTLNKNVDSRNERIITVPPPPPSETLFPSLHVVVGGPLATDIDSPPVVRIPASSNDTIVVPVVKTEKVDNIINSSSKTVEMAPVLENRDADTLMVTPHREVVITGPQKSNQNDPQDEIKAASPLIQVNASLRGPVVNSLVVPMAIFEGIKEGNTPTVGSVSTNNSLDERVVPTTTPIEQRTISSTPTSSIHSVIVQESIPTRDPITRDRVVVDTLSESKVAPLPTKLISEEESSENEEQTSHKKAQSLTLAENQEDLVGKQTVVVGGDDMKKVVVDEGERNEIGREKVQVASNQPTFHAPTVFEESQIIGNNGVTFPLAVDKASSSLEASVTPIHNGGLQVVGTDAAVDQPDTNGTVVVVQPNTATENIDVVVRNTGIVSGKKSENSGYAAATKETENGSIVGPIVNKHVEQEEVRFPVASVTNENIDVLSQHVAALPQNNSIHKEFSNVVGSNISTETGAIPLSNSVGTTGSLISDVPLNVDKPSDNGFPALSMLASDISKDVLFQPENTILSIPQTSSVVTTQPKDVNLEEIRNVPDISAVTDPTKLPANISQEVDRKTIVLVPGISKPVVDVETVVAPVLNEDPVKNTDSIQTINVNTLSPLEVPMIANPLEIINNDNLRPSLVETRNPEAVKVDSVISIKPDLEKVDVGPSVGNVSVVAPTAAVLTNNTLMKVSKNPIDPKVTLLEIPIVPVIAVPEKVISADNNMVAPVEIPVVDVEKVSSQNISPVKVTSITPVEVLQIPNEKVVPEVSVIKPHVIITQQWDPLIEPEPLVLKPSPAMITSVPLVDPILKPAHVVLPEPFVTPVLKDPVHSLKPVKDVVITSDPLVDPVLIKPAQNVVPEPLVTQVLSVAHESIPETPIESGQIVTNVVQPEILDASSSSQLVAAVVVPTSEIPSKVPSNPADDVIIGSLPQTDPDSHFGIKPINTQPHFQIPGLKPSIPERPHPDYLSIISQGVDTDPLIFSTPTIPVIIPSPPVYSGYSPAAIFRKQQQMMQNYFSGLLYRRALPV